MEENKSKYQSQMKNLRNNYKQFRMDLKNEVYKEFKEICTQNNTTPTTVIKAFINDYIEKNK